MPLDAIYVYTIIAGMAVATYATRATPILFLRSKKLNGKIVLWLSFVPVSVMAALLMPELLIVKDDPDNLYVWVGLATFVVAFLLKNFFITIIFGMLLLALLRYFL